MKTFNAKQIQTRPSFVFRSVCREPVKITNRNFGDLLLISPDSIFSIRDHNDGTVAIHLRSLPDEIVNSVKERIRASEPESLP